VSLVSLIRGKESTTRDQDRDRNNDSTTWQLNRSRSFKIKDSEVLEKLQIARVQPEDDSGDTSMSQSFFNDYIRHSLSLANMQEVLSQTKGVARDEDHHRHNGARRGSKSTVQTSAPLVLGNGEDVDDTISEVKILIDRVLLELSDEPELKPQHLADMSALADRAAGLLKPPPGVMVTDPNEELVELLETDDIRPAPPPPRRILRFSGDVYM
jgi:hypothetical protein